MKNQQDKNGKQDEQVTSQTAKQQASDPEHKRIKKPGSQSNSSKQSNNGRGGGK